MPPTSPPRSPARTTPRCSAPQGPTFVSIPEDDWDADADTVTRPRSPRRLRGRAEALGAVAAALNESSHPAFVVGPGVDRDRRVGSGRRPRRAHRRDRMGEPPLGPVQLPRGPPCVRRLPHSCSASARRAARSARCRRRARRAGLHLPRAFRRSRGRRGHGVVPAHRRSRRGGVRPGGLCGRHDAAQGDR